jgi:hypothetical protein
MFDDVVASVGQSDYEYYEERYEGDEDRLCERWEGDWHHDVRADYRYTGLRDVPHSDWLCGECFLLLKKGVLSMRKVEPRKRRLP